MALPWREDWLVGGGEKCAPGIDFRGEVWGSHGGLPGSRIFLWVREGTRITVCGGPGRTKGKQAWSMGANQKVFWPNDARAKHSDRIWTFASIGKKKNTKRKKF